MCEPTDPIKVIREIPWRIAALVGMLPSGSNERRMLDAVKIAIEHDLEYVRKQILPEDIKRWKESKP